MKVVSTITLSNLRIKKLYQLRIEEGTDIRDHLNVFKILTTLLSSMEVKNQD
jgi:hypothetical protein